jgi:CHAD domain-containing protein
MTMPLPLEECYERRARYFVDRFAAASRSPSTGAIHDMRVGLKRLRTFFNLVGSIDANFRTEEAFAPARKLFRAAGRVRNLQILGSKTREAAAAASLELSEFYNWLKEDELREIRRFGRVCDRFRRDFFASAWTTIEKSFEGLAPAQLRKNVEARLLDLIREIKAERFVRRDVRRLHFLRIRTKEARYTLEILQECGLTGDDGDRLNERLRDIHQSLGRWHDEEIVLESLREFRKSRVPAPPLISFKSYLGFSRITRARKAEDLTGFEEGWAALLAFLGRGQGRRVLRPSRAAGPVPDGEQAQARMPPENG